MTVSSNSEVGPTVITGPCVHINHNTMNLRSTLRKRVCSSSTHLFSHAFSYPTCFIRSKKREEKLCQLICRGSVVVKKKPPKNWAKRCLIGSQGSVLVGSWVSSGKQLQRCTVRATPLPPSLRVTSDRRSGRTEYKTPAELCEFIGCCCSCISHIRGALCCQARFQSRALTAFVSPQRLVIKAAASGGKPVYIFINLFHLTANKKN